MAHEDNGDRTKLNTAVVVTAGEVPDDRAIVPRPNFIELPARDLAASQTFFETVFGMTMTSFGPTYACTLTGDVDIGLQADQQEATKHHSP